MSLVKKVILTQLKKNKVEYNKFLEFINNNVNLLKLNYTAQYWHYSHNITDIPICKNSNCNNNTSFKNFKKGYPLYCSNKCSNTCTVKKQHTIESCLEKYGVENPTQTKEIQNKIKSTVLEKYGVENILKSNEIRNKIKKTTLEKYGVENVFQVDKIKEKIKNTNLEKYGHEYPSQSDIVQSIRKDNTILKYGVEHHFMLDSVQEKIKQSFIDNDSYSKMINSRYETLKLRWEDTCKERYNNIVSLDYNNKELTLLCAKCDTTYTVSSFFIYQRHFKYNVEPCVICNPINVHSSGAQLAIINFVLNYVDEEDIIINDRNTINPLELDIYIPHLNLAIEYNGLYYHSEMYKDKMYHRNKFNLCLTKNIKLLQIWEDDWLHNQSLIKSILSSHFNSNTKFYARQCSIKEISNETYKEFVETNHLQGYAPAKIRIGLYFNDELVSLMGFSKERIIYNNNSNNNNLELIRYCSKQYVNIVGGASKIFSYFRTHYIFDKVISYQNLDFGLSKLYENLGFKFVKLTEPGYYYNINGVKAHRFKYTKSKLVEQGYDPTKTEVEIMNELGYYRVFTSGNAVWEYSN